MQTRAIRGAITLNKNSKDEIKGATVELTRAILKENNVKIEDIAFVIYTVTSDIDAAFPAKFAREEFDFSFVPMMCYREMEVKGAIELCLRALVVINTDKTQKEIKHQYLKGAQKLRPDITE